MNKTETSYIESVDILLLSPVYVLMLSRQGMKSDL